MNNSIGESSSATKTFRFNSGQLLTLNECQIEKIPYLTALISAEPHFDSIKVDEGFYLLDSSINHQDFLFALDSISFHSVRQIFTELPKNYNILSIIALLDFLCIAPKRSPTLEEVDSSFFWNIECGDPLGTYQLIYSSSDSQDMAVRFAIAMVKEEYNFRNIKTLDQIYWFIMFILSAHDLFETHLRYHVYKIAKNYFSVFCPSLLKCLCRLNQRTEKEIREKSISISDHIDSRQKIDLLWYSNTFDENFRWHSWSHTFLSSEHFWLWPISFVRWENYPYRSIGYRERFLYTDENLEPIYNKVTKYMYKFLLSVVLEQVSTITPDHKLHGFDRLTYEAILDNILNRNTVQVAIQGSILSKICELTAEVEQKYNELKEKMHAYERNLIKLIEDQTQSYSLRQIVWTTGESTLKTKQNEALTCERTLKTLYEYESLLNNIRNTVLNELRHQFINDIEGFINRRYAMCVLLNSISSIQKENEDFLESKKNKRMYTSTEYRPLPKLQRKHTAR